MISSFLKVIHIFSINPYLGPLQVSLGKMIIDIAKWLILYVLVLFSFGCGLNQLLWSGKRKKIRSFKKKVCKLATHTDTWLCKVFCVKDCLLQSMCNSLS